MTVRAGAVAVSFDSPVSQADWNKILRLNPPPEGITTVAELVRYLKKLAWRLVADGRLRETLPTAVAWFDRFTSRLPTYARQAITCGGRTLGTVQICGNRVFGFVRGVHVGSSGKMTEKEEQEGKLSARLRRVGHVHVADNHLSLRKPADDAYVPAGLFVGNVDTVRIQRNTLDWAGQATDNYYRHGIRVWGDIGRYLKISDNRIVIAYIGIAVQPVIHPEEHARYLWVASDNLSEPSASNNVVRAPEFLLRRDNRPQ